MCPRFIFRQSQVLASRFKRCCFRNSLGPNNIRIDAGLLINEMILAIYTDGLGFVTLWIIQRCLLSGVNMSMCTFNFLCLQVRQPFRDFLCALLVGRSEPSGTIRPYMMLLRTVDAVVRPLRVLLTKARQGSLMLGLNVR
jgi:hypothetical protein